MGKNGHQSILASAPVHPWERTNNPWVRLHIDYLGPFMGKTFLVIVDSCSKWVEVFPVLNSTSQTTINCLRTCFATHRLPEICVSDNGSCFTSEEFEKEQNFAYQIHSLPSGYKKNARKGLLEILKTLLEIWKGQAV